MEGSADCAPALAPHAGADCERDLASTCFAWRQLCKCDHCDEEWPLIDMAQWEYKAWETGVSWCRCDAQAHATHAMSYEMDAAALYESYALCCAHASACGAHR